MKLYIELLSGSTRSVEDGTLAASAPRGSFQCFRLYATRFAWAAFTLVAFAMFVLGTSGHTRVLVNADGWDEVFVVVGCFFFFPVSWTVYRLATRLSRVMAERRYSYYTLIILLFLTYAAQQCLFMAYLVLYVNKLCWLFLIPDVAVAGMMLYERVVHVRYWSIVYILSQAGKLATFWSAISEDGAFLSNSRLGPDLFFGTFALTLPVVQFPVLLSRLRVGSTLTEAYTTNMAAVFAHVLHFMDVLELYFSGLQGGYSGDDVQLLLLFFAVVGYITSNVYYIALFFKDDVTVRFLRHFEESNRDGMDLFAPIEPSKDDELMHYFLWAIFFIDVPYAAMRLVSFIVNGKEISTFFGKNLMMVVGVVMLMARGRRG